MDPRCCRSLIGGGVPAPSPFSRVIATGYYDGPTDGVVECRACSTLYSFRTLDWDSQQDMRIFALAPIPGRSMSDFTCTGTEATRPTWPVWILGDRGTEEIAGAVQVARMAASPDAFVIATENLLGSIEVWRPVGLTPAVDWFAELGLKRERSPE
jgi:hypothetical protein